MSEHDRPAPEQVTLMANVATALLHRFITAAGGTSLLLAEDAARSHDITIEAVNGAFILRAVPPRSGA